MRAANPCRPLLAGLALLFASCGGGEENVDVNAEAIPKDGEEMVAPPVEGEAFAIPSAGMEMLWCPPGTFQMGSPEGEKDRGRNETLHAVTLSQGFWLGKHEVTQAQWEKVMGSNPSSSKGPNHPVEKVSWEDAVVFCKKLTELERKAGRVPDGWAYQLPTEAQWEYACRAGTRTRFSFGDEEVDKCPANAWGFHDMHGSVWEWCRDWSGYDYYEQVSAKRDPLGPAVGTHRVGRGGLDHHLLELARSAKRFSKMPGFRRSYLGFRLSFSVHEQTE